MKEPTKLCPFHNMRPCVQGKCSLWRIDVCVFMNIDNELFTAVDIMIGANQARQKPEEPAPDNTISDFLREEAERLSTIPESAFESTVKDGVEMFRFKPMEPREKI